MVMLKKKMMTKNLSTKKKYKNYIKKRYEKSTVIDIFIALFVILESCFEQKLLA